MFVFVLIDLAAEVQLLVKNQKHFSEFVSTVAYVQEESFATELSI